MNTRLVFVKNEVDHRIPRKKLSIFKKRSTFWHSFLNDFEVSSLSPWRSPKIIFWSCKFFPRLGKIRDYGSDIFLAQSLIFFRDFETTCYIDCDQIKQSTVYHERTTVAFSSKQCGRYVTLLNVRIRHALGRRGHGQRSTKTPQVLYLSTKHGPIKFHPRPGLPQIYQRCY